LEGVSLELALEERWAEGSGQGPETDHDQVGADDQVAAHEQVAAHDQVADLAVASREPQS
jgi:hypothetical protein